MSETTTTSGDVDRRETPADAAPYAYPMPDGTGWLYFAGTLLGVAGIMRIIDSIWAFTYNGALPDNLQDGVIGENLNNYGWLWLVVGVVLLASSFAVLSRSQVARWVGITAACIAMISAITWMPYYPIWSLAYIGLSVSVIYALTVYGGHEA